MTTAATPNNPRFINRQAQLRRDRYDMVAAAYGWKTNAAAAEALGISESTVSRILSGKQAPNLQFILALLQVAEPLTGFRRMFEIVIVPDEEVNTE